MNKNLDSLTEYPFYFLRELLSAVENNAEETLGLHIGEPKSIPPEEALNLLNKHSDLYSKYPTCLLYTSPSPRDRTRSRMPSSA